ncbi:unnamed protein product [Rhodiola kirilowii]
MELPPGFFKSDKSCGKVCRLLKSLYGLKHGPRQWFSKFSAALLKFGFVQSLNDYSLFTYTRSGQFLALLVYVDDIVLTGTSNDLIVEVKQFIDSQFRVKDLGLLKYFLGIEVARSPKGIFINQRKYALDLLLDTGLIGCKPSVIPMDTKIQLALSKTAPVEDVSSYRRLVGQLIYLTVTRLDLAFSVHIISQFMHAPTIEHLAVAHKVLRYVKGAPAQGLFYPADQPLILQAYCDADWGSCPITRKSWLLCSSWELSGELEN